MSELGVPRRLFLLYKVIRTSWPLSIGAAGTLTQTPVNQIGLKEDQIVLRCSSDISPNAITWQYDSATISGTGCQTSITGFTTSDNGGTATDCFLQAQGTSSLRLSGPYTCSDGTVPNAQAVVVILGQYNMV